MKTYIVLDLEWNQSPDGKEESVDGLPFEIIELGAVKLDEDFNVLSEFRRVIKPVVYKKIHFKVCEVIHMGIEELKKQGQLFSDAAGEFLDWCMSGEEKPVFCSWGNMDMTELQRNMEYHKMDNIFPYPFLYYDIQKLYGLSIGDFSKNKIPLDRAVTELGLNTEREFHRALDDAFYTAMVMRAMDFESVKAYMSLDYFRTPKNSDEEIYLLFPDYSKYVSRPFLSKEDAIADKTVTDMICPRCNRMLRKRVRWFSYNQKNYYGLASCPQHGFVKGKIRMRSRADESIYVIKTMKLVGDEGAESVYERKEYSVKRRREKNRQKRLKVKGNE